GRRPESKPMRDISTSDTFMKDIFSGESENLLPEGGTALYFGAVMPRDAADRYFHELMRSTQWRNDEAVIFGKHFVTKRKVAWYGDAEYSYTYSNTTKEALPWTPVLLELKQVAERLTGSRFNSCLLNLYH